MSGPEKLVPFDRHFIIISMVKRAEIHIKYMMIFIFGKSLP
jgi:hypothetical protein